MPKIQPVCQARARAPNRSQAPNPAPCPKQTLCPTFSSVPQIRPHIPNTASNRKQTLCPKSSPAPQTQVRGPKVPQPDAVGARGLGMAPVFSDLEATGEDRNGGSRRPNSCGVWSAQPEEFSTWRLPETTHALLRKELGSWLPQMTDDSGSPAICN